MTREKVQPWRPKVPTNLVGPPDTYDRANATMVENTVYPQTSAGSGQAENGGMRVVLNIASAHVPNFCKDGYKNVYELSVGDEQKKPSQTRQSIDTALKGAVGIEPGKTYFAAIELTGAGIRFYGDMCLVLKPDKVPGETAILDRNSYDLSRSPLVEKISGSTVKREQQATTIAGILNRDLGPMAIIKVMSGASGRDRRLTTGEIAEQLRADEDYIEVLLEQKIDTTSLAEVRLAAGDAAVEALISSRLSTGSAPKIAQLTYRDQCRAASEALHDAGVALHIVTTSGRVKG
jgi:hypothetical protein